MIFTRIRSQFFYCAIWFVLGMIFMNLLQDSGSEFSSVTGRDYPDQPHVDSKSDTSKPGLEQSLNWVQTVNAVTDEGATNRQHLPLKNITHIPEEGNANLGRNSKFNAKPESRLTGEKLNIDSSAGHGAHNENSKPSGCAKTLHIYSPLVTFIPELHHFVNLFQASNKTDHESDIDCVSVGYECDLRLTIGADIDSIKGKDAVLFGFVAVGYRRNRRLQRILEVGPEPGQTWIYYSTETPYRVVKWMENLDIARLKYHVLMTYSSESDIHIPFGYYKPFNRIPDDRKESRFLTDEFYKNRSGLIAWVASNCDDVFWPRKPFTAEIRKHLPLDTYGRCGSKECLPKRSPECNQLFESYKFYLAIPNSECRDYITEKFWLTSLKHGLVPVVVGTQKKDYAKWAPPNSFIHFGEFETLEEVFKHLNRVDRDENWYRKYHAWRNHGEVVTTFPVILETVCKTVPYIFEREPNEFKLVGDSPWYNGCRESPEMALKRSYNTLEEFVNWTVWR